MIRDWDYIYNFDNSNQEHPWIHEKKLQWLLVYYEVHIGVVCPVYSGIIFPLWGSMFIGSQNFRGSWGRNFIDSVIRIILIKINKWFCTGWCGCKFVGKVYPRKPCTLVDPPTNSDDSLVFSQNTCTCMHNTSTYNKF